MRLLAACACVCVVLGATPISEPVANGLFGSRGGDIVVTHATPIKGDARLIAIDAKHEDLASRNHRSLGALEMPETDVAGIITHVLGARPLTAEIPEQVGAFPSSTILSKPRANLLINLPSVGQLTLSDLSMTQVEELNHLHPSYSLTNTFEPRNTLSALSTLATGVTPSAHGIVGSRWMTPTTTQTSPTVAYSSGVSNANVPTVADAVGHSFKGSLIVSLSGCNQLASASATHVDSGIDSVVLSVDSDTRRVRNTASLDNTFDLNLDNDVLSKFVANTDSASVFKTLRSDGGTISITGTEITVSFKGATVTFDLSSSADFKFFAELAAVESLTDKLSEVLKSRVEDLSPDMYTITLMGFHKISNEYGLNSDKAKMAAQITDAVVPQVVSFFSKAYRSDVATQVVLMGSVDKDSFDQAQKSVVAAGVPFHSEVGIASSFPTIYVEESLTHKEVEQMCSRVHEAVSMHGFKAECVSELTRPALIQQKAQLKADSSDSSTDIINYQINLWVSLILLGCLLGGLYPLLYLDYYSGTFSSFLFAKKYV